MGVHSVQALDEPDYYEKSFTEAGQSNYANYPLGYDDLNALARNSGWISSNKRN